MLKIGEFSKLSLVSVKALRYYDERGLLKPAHVDSSSGYRFYSASQLTRLNRILAMKDMGLDLSQIALLLDQDPTPDQIRGMLRLKQVELHHQLREGQAQLTRIETWLQAFEQEATMPEYDVVLKKVAPLRVAQARGISPKMGQPELGITLGRLFGEVTQAINQQGAVIAGPGMTIFYDPDFREQDVDVGACLAFTGDLRESEQVKVIELPAAETMASVIHRGSFTIMHQAYHAIMGWVAANGYRVSGPNREINLEFEPGGDESKFVTEIQFPIEKVEA